MDRMTVTANELAEMVADFKKPPVDDPNHPDTSETVNISSVALLKMLRHAQSGYPLEVTGLMLGVIIDNYKIKIEDVVEMPQCGRRVTAESFDPVYQTKHMDLLKLVGRTENVVGWYKSNIESVCYPSSRNLMLQRDFEEKNNRSLALIVDPKQSVGGNVSIMAYRTIHFLKARTTSIAPTEEARETTSDLSELNRPSFHSETHGINIKYYTLKVAFKMSPKEQDMLLNLSNKKWNDQLRMKPYSELEKEQEEKFTSINKLITVLNTGISEDGETPTNDKKGKNKEKIVTLGKVDVKHQLQMITSDVLNDSLCHQLNAMIITKSMN